MFIRVFLFIIILILIQRIRDYPLSKVNDHSISTIFKYSFCPNCGRTRQLREEYPENQPKKHIETLDKTAYSQHLQTEVCHHQWFSHSQTIYFKPLENEIGQSHGHKRSRNWVNFLFDDNYYPFFEAYLAKYEGLKGHYKFVSLLKSDADFAFKAMTMYLKQTNFRNYPHAFKGFDTKKELNLLKSFDRFIELIDENDVILFWKKNSTG